MEIRMESIEFENVENRIGIEFPYSQPNFFTQIHFQFKCNER